MKNGYGKPRQSFWRLPLSCKAGTPPVALHRTPFVSGSASGILGVGLTGRVRPLVNLWQLYLETDTAVPLGWHSQTKLWLHLQVEKQDGLCGNPCCFLPL